MPYKIIYIEENSIVEVFYYGQVTGEDIRKAVAESVETQVKNNALKSLINTLEVTDSIASITDVHFIPQNYYKKKNISRKKIIALIDSDIPSVKQIVNDYYNTCFNQGWKIKMFKNRGDAVEWLIENS